MDEGLLGMFLTMGVVLLIVVCYYYLSLHYRCREVYSTNDLQSEPGFEDVNIEDAVSNVSGNVDPGGQNDPEEQRVAGVRIRGREVHFRYSVDNASISDSDIINDMDYPRNDTVVEIKTEQSKTV